MSYNISTMFIWQYFNNECECPTCRLRQKTESDLADTYLSEAVMEDAERMRVNKYGFCKEHYDLLYSGRNKLGVALQISTRIKTLNRYLKKPKDAKSAKKLAETLKNETCDCVICRKSTAFKLCINVYGVHSVVFRGADLNLGVAVPKLDLQARCDDL